MSTQMEILIMIVIIVSSVGQRGGKPAPSTLFSPISPQKKVRNRILSKAVLSFFLLLFFHNSIFFKLSQDSGSENTGRPGDPLRDSRSHFNPTPLLTRLSCSLGNPQVRIWQRSKKKKQICFLVHFITWQEKVMSSRG